MTRSDPFRSGIQADIESVRKARESGQNLVRASEIGVMLSEESPHARRQSSHRPVANARDLAKWEQTSQVNLQRTMDDKFTMFICGKGISPWSAAGQKMLKDLESGRITIPTATDSKKAKQPSSFTSTPLAQSLNEGRKSVSGVRLEPAPRNPWIER